MGLFDRTRRETAPSSPPQPVADADDLGSMPGVVVVRCAEGPTQDTIDQVLACRDRGIADLTVVLDHDGVGDGIDAEIVELVEAEMRDLLERHGWTSEHVTVVSG